VANCYMTGDDTRNPADDEEAMR